MKNLYELAEDLTNFFQEKYNIQNKPSIEFQEDTENSKNPLGKTAHYDPTNQSIKIYITGRHIKDCLRSLAHELVHHLQFERGDLDGCNPAVKGYAQKDPHLRQMEKEANLKGSMCLRDWEDGLKEKKETNYIAEISKGDAKMSIKEWKNNEMNEMLMEKWGFAPKEGSFLTEGMGTYDLSNADYATAELEETPEELEEEELGEEVKAQHPQSTESKLKDLEEEEINEQKIHEVILEVLEELGLADDSTEKSK